MSKLDQLVKRLATLCGITDRYKSEMDTKIATGDIKLLLAGSVMI